MTSSRLTWNALVFNAKIAGELVLAVEQLDWRVSDFAGLRARAVVLGAIHIRDAIQRNVKTVSKIGNSVVLVSECNDVVVWTGDGFFAVSIDAEVFSGGRR